MSLSDLSTSGAPHGPGHPIPPTFDVPAAFLPSALPVAAEPTRGRIAVTSVFGDALDPKTWSGAPHNLAQQLRGLGYEVSGLHLREPRSRSLWNACRHVVLTGGRSLKWESVMRDPAARMARAADVTQAARSKGIDRLLHTGTLDLPDPTGDDSVGHYLYCDHTWDLAVRHRPEARYRQSREVTRYEEMEAQAYASTRHIFTFGRYVRDNLIEHYGIPAERVTAVGSGMGRIEPYHGPKDYAHGPLLFIAKHLFQEKGGHLAIQAFRIARRQRPDLRLVVAGNDRWRALIGDEPGVHVVGHLPWASLEALAHSASLLLQPMLNDPWGQVYLEALASRTPVVGLHRNGLPEITENGRHGFMAPAADPVVLAETILDAMSDPDRLAAMGNSGQRHVLGNYSWDRTARAVADVLGRERS